MRAQVWMGQALTAASALGYYPALITMTVSHGSSDSCASALARFLEVRKVFLRRVSSKSWAGRIGSCDALEATFGANGFHHHGHSLWFNDRPFDADLIDRLKRAWMQAAADCGATASYERGLDVEPFRGTPADAPDWLAAVYASKGESLTWEVAGAAAKRSRKGSLTVSDLIALSEFDDSACRLAADYFNTMAGRVRFNCGALASKLGIAPMSECEDEHYDDVIDNVPPPEQLARVSIADLRLLAGLWARAELGLISVASKYGQRGVDVLVRRGKAIALARGVAPLLPVITVPRHEKPIGAWTFSDWRDAANDPNDPHHLTALRYA
jgi:diadenosine tetraphosphatase ApaH/serine/threonine PP2A family protein phosphatase